MISYRLTITLHDLMYYASREIGRYYISERYLHNYALTYALGFVHSQYHDAVQVPRYQKELEPLNESGVYVTPAKPLRIETASHTFKFADTRYQVKMEQSSVNIPTFGRIREVSPESQFEAFIFSQNVVKIPTWIRLGKWMSKARVGSQTLEVTQGDGAFTTLHPLNALDTELSPQLYDLINMPPVSLINNARFEGKYLKVKVDDKATRSFPAELRYTF